VPTRPKVSACIPVYNPGDFLQSAIVSVLAQDFKDFELIIVDDCSTQPTEAVIAEFDDERLSFRRNSRNLGLVGNWNRCLGLAQGVYVTIFHQDDIMHPSNLRRKVEALDANPDAGFAYSNIQRIDATGQIVGGHWLPQPPSDTVLSGDDMFAMIASLGNPISCPSVMARRECYQRLGFFDVRLPFTADLEMWMRISTVYKAVYIAEPLILQRVHSGQETTRFQGTGRDYRDVMRAFDIVCSRHLSSVQNALMSKAYKTLSTQAFMMARWKFRQGQISNGLRYSAVAVGAFRRSITACGIKG